MMWIKPHDLNSTVDTYQIVQELGSGLWGDIPPRNVVEVHTACLVGDGIGPAPSFYARLADSGGCAM